MMDLCTGKRRPINEGKFPITLIKKRTNNKPIIKEKKKGLIKK